MKLIKTLQKIILLLSFMLPSVLFALSFPIPKGHDDIVGRVKTITLEAGDDLVDICQRYQVGYLELLEANPGLDLEDLYEGNRLVIPTKYILPMVPREGIIINLAELRLYYYSKNGSHVLTFPIGIGKIDEPTPVLRAKIIEKKVDPIWRPTEKTRELAMERGIYLPEVVMPGPENPLGEFAMRLSEHLYLIHGTNAPDGVGKRSSGGCIRMFPNDMRKLFSLVPIGTPVEIIDQPFKAGWKDEQLYLEAHVPVNLKRSRAKNAAELASKVVGPQLLKWHVEVDWDKALKVANRQRGIPEPIGASHRRHRVFAEAPSKVVSGKLLRY